MAKAIALEALLAAVVLGLTFAALFTLRTMVDIAPVVRPISMVATMLCQAGFIGIAWYLARRHGAGLYELGLRGFHPVFFPIAWSLLLVGYAGTLLYSLGLRSFGIIVENPQRIGELVGQDPATLAVAMIAGGIVAPLAEETFFRGFVLPGLIGKLGVVGAVAASSLLFAIAHIYPQIYVPIFMLGVLLAILRLTSRSVWPAIVLHSTFNTVSLIAVYLVQTREGAA